MAWPNSRLRPYSPASPIPSADMNAIQDAIVQGAHGDKTLVLGTLAEIPTAGAWEFVTAGAVYELRSTGSGICVIPIPLIIGDRIKSLTIGRYGDGAADLILSVVKRFVAGSVSAISSVTITNPPASYADTTLDVIDT